ncbi:hypothetical protein Bca52824_032325 [Brassica carinata]|uniref:F-box associated beta-propeller type 1 domain-containing protein n=1 Tax=Brassica carinata TaxID=52824 RepID=A0A8X7V633_BRACI|nr:hypothetical protein Bca52824_032325 [Brassica carinata]
MAEVEELVLRGTVCGHNTDMVAAIAAPLDNAKMTVTSSRDESIPIETTTKISDLPLGVSLKGNTYFPGSQINREEDNYIICFDFTSESFGPLLRLPFDAGDDDHVTLSCVREEKLAVLLTRKKLEFEIWISTEIEAEKVSWSKFLRVETEAGFYALVSCESFFIDEERKVAMGYYKTFNIVGEDGYLKELVLVERADRDVNYCSRPVWPILFAQHGVCLKGSTYWLDLKGNRQQELKDQIVCFDFTKKLAVLLTRKKLEFEIWISTEIEAEKVSWSKFLRVETEAGFYALVSCESFFIDEERKVAMGYYKTFNIVGEDGYLKELVLVERADRDVNYCSRPVWPILFAQHGVCLKGSTYWLDLKGNRQQELKDQIVCFDFTSETYRPLLLSGHLRLVLLTT